MQRQNAPTLKVHMEYYNREYGYEYRIEERIGSKEVTQNTK
ncbi:hypothetical protein ACT8ZS_12450 [Paenibacillus sp. M.A.Huq-84]